MTHQSEIRKINKRYYKLAKKNNCNILASYITDVNELHLECRSCNSVFSRSPWSLKNKIVCFQCRQDKKNKREKYKSEAKEPNKGHFFEYLMSIALRECGHTVDDLENLRITKAKLETKDKMTILLIKKFLSSHIKTKNKFHAVTDLENKNCISSDFLSKNIGLSCKKDNNAIKHPHIGAIWNFLSSSNLWDEILPNYKNYNCTRDEFFKHINLDNESFFNLFMEEKYKIISLKKSDGSKVKEIYSFLFGKEQPCIVKLIENDFTSHLEVQDTRKLKEPTKLNFKLITNSNGRKQLQIHFNNGVSVQMRLKYAKNAEFSSAWWNVFKEEWTVIKTKTWEDNKKIIKI